MKILSGHAIEAMPPVEPQQIKLQINHDVLKKLGIPILNNQGKPR
jgi:ABC-type uncharacterized transport system substrate-binding protein